MAAPKTVFGSREEWQAEVARRRKERGPPEESSIEKMQRRARDRSYASEVEELAARVESLREGLGEADLKDWPAQRPRFIEGGIVQEDGGEVVYDFSDLERWRSYVSECRRYRDGLRCGHCYAVAPKAPLRRMALCSQCKTIRYCSSDCQRTDWKLRHKRNCSQPP